MNDLAREKLVEAAMKGVRQIRGKKFSDERGGLCALGVLGWKNDWLACDSQLASSGEDDLMRRYGMSHGYLPCPADGCSRIEPEHHLIVHLNDVHDWDFLTIARKVGVREESAS